MGTAKRRTRWLASSSSTARDANVLFLAALFAIISVTISCIEAANSPTLNADADIGIGSPNPGNPSDHESINGIGSPNPGNLHSKGDVNENNHDSSLTRHKKQSQKQWQKDKISRTKENDKITHNYHSYLHWCEAVLGIQSVVEIKEFQYIDHLKINWDSNVDDVDPKSFDWLDLSLQGSSNNKAAANRRDDPTITIRGLAAKHDIQVGDIVISIPLYSLLSIPTTIDHDPVLSRILGPEAREQYGWTNTLEYEVPLLVIAILYHRSLGQDSPLWRYIDLLSGSSTEYLPFLWSESELKSRTGEIGIEVRELARGIRSDVYEMYDLIMGTLVKAHGEIFGPPEGYTPNKNDENEWHFSYDNFQWAFAMVISRHHFLPIAEFDEDSPPKKTIDSTIDSLAVKPDSSAVMHETLTSVSDLPPANQPTDSWVEEAINEERVRDDTDISTDDDIAAMGTIKHSFMAPLADLINFGPPCLKGSYNIDQHAFELIATCPFKIGQEVTFYYSGDCSDIMIANYGFLHPLIPPCTNSDVWKDKAEALEKTDKMRDGEMWDLYQQMDLLKEELGDLHTQVIECGCEDGEKKTQKLRKENNHPSRHDIGVRGHSHNADDHDVEDL